MKKTIFKTIPAAILASLCLTTAASAYIDMGVSVPYSVKNDSRTWSNKNNTWAWFLTTTSNCYFSGTVTSDCKANYTLYEWTFAQSEYKIRSLKDRTYNFSSYILSDELYADDDYFARVEYVSGGINNGTVTFRRA